MLYKTLENKSRYAHWVGRDPRKEKTTTERSYFHGIDSSNKTFSIILLNTIEMLQKISFNIQYLVMANEDGSYRVYNKIITEEEENSYKFKKAI